MLFSDIKINNKHLISQQAEKHYNSKTQNEQEKTVLPLAMADAHAHRKLLFCSMACLLSDMFCFHASSNS